LEDCVSNSLCVKYAIPDCMCQVLHTEGIEVPWMVEMIAVMAFSFWLLLTSL